MSLKKNLSILLSLPILLAESVSAHCPLCTVGVGVAAAGAVWLGVSKVVVALLIGAFAMSMGMWFSRAIEKRKKFIPFQSPLIIIGVFFLTVLPLMPIVKAVGPLYLSFVGDYGRTYALNYSLISSLFGGIITFASPEINKKIREKRNGKGIPFQGVLLTFFLLTIAAAIIQFII